MVYMQSSYNMWSFACVINLIRIIEARRQWNTIVKDGVNCQFRTQSNESSLRMVVRFHFWYSGVNILLPFLPVEYD